MNLSAVRCICIFCFVLNISFISPASNENKRGYLKDICSDLGFSKILLVERHAIHSSHVYTYHEEDNKPGGGIYIYDLNSKSSKKILDSKRGLVLDANLHYDGKTILFSWKKEMDRFFQLYTMNTDGNNLKQITNHPSNNFNACWLPDNGV